jgi:23S rRNA (uracil1939-C5)-methyltransferase
MLSYQLPEFDLDFVFAPTDFTQVNLEVNRNMVQQAISLLALKSNDCVLDAFCGIGNFSLAVARSAGQVLGLEQSEDSVARARMNAQRNGIENAEFDAANLHQDSIEIPEIQRINKVLLDPPRSGALELVKGLASSNVERVVYVSCNPETLARDIKVLVGQGLQLQSAGIIDMFPHTTHVESIALLTRPGQPT